MERTRSIRSPAREGSSCPRPNQILEFMQRGLADKDAAGFEQHIDACAECCALLADLARLDCASDEPAEP